MNSEKGLALNYILLIILIILAISLSGAAIYLGILSKKGSNADTSGKTGTSRIFPTSSPSSGGKQTRLLVNSPERGENLFFIQGIVDSFDGTTIKVSWKGDTDSIKLWQDSNELSVTYEGQQGKVVKKGELILNPGDFVMYQVGDKILFVKPK